MEHIKLGLKANGKQFALLVGINALVGGMIGMERSIFSQFALEQFGVASKTALLSFIAAFGVSKAVANYYTGKLANSVGRKNLLIIGWLIALPVPLLLMGAQSWSWVVAANVLLGISQGLAWSSTVVMKIDLVGEKNRGLAMGLNEFAGYASVGIVAFVTSYIAQQFGVTPYPFYIGLGLAILGLISSYAWVKDTQVFAYAEQQTSTSPQLKQVFLETTLKNKTLSAITQGGLVNNLNDGMIWGLLPPLLANLHYPTQNIGLVAATYPMVWGVAQLFTGKLSDHYNKKALLVWGMTVQGLAILILPFTTSLAGLLVVSSTLGLGTALVYPTFLSAIAQATLPKQRAESLGTFRFWRDLGYAVGALLSGITTDWFGLQTAILFIGIITLTSALILKLRMPKSTP